MPSAKASTPSLTRECNGKLDLAFNNVKPKGWYFVLDKV